MDGPRQESNLPHADSRAHIGMQQKCLKRVGEEVASRISSLIRHRRFAGAAPYVRTGGIFRVPSCSRSLRTTREKRRRTTQAVDVSRRNAIGSMSTKSKSEPCALYTMGVWWLGVEDWLLTAHQRRRGADVPERWETLSLVAAPGSRG